MELTGRAGMRRLLSLGGAAAVATVVIFASAFAAAASAGPVAQPAKPKPPSLKGEGDGVAESIADKITDPSFTRPLWGLVKEGKTGPSIEDVLHQLALIHAKLDVLDRKLDEIAAQVAEIRTPTTPPTRRC